MANIISDETIEYVGILAKLELSDEEKEQAKSWHWDSPCLTDLTTRNQKGTIRRSLPVRQALSAYRQAANTYAAFSKPAEACKVS